MSNSPPQHDPVSAVAFRRWVEADLALRGADIAGTNNAATSSSNACPHPRCILYRHRSAFNHRGRDGFYFTGQEETP